MSSSVVERAQSHAEEIANSVSHGLGFAAVAVAAPLLIAHAVTAGGPLFAIGAGIFVASAALLYLGSAVFHALPPGRAKHTFRIMEHGAIFVLIAGTYTPFTLGVLRGAWGWSLLALVWVLALLGVLLKATGGPGHPRLSLALYLGMGWLVVVAIRPLWERVPLPGLLLIAAGGLAYTVGTIFFAADRLRYGHFIWHLFVIAGTTCHFLAVWSYAA